MGILAINLHLLVHGERRFKPAARTDVLQQVEDLPVGLRLLEQELIARKREDLDLPLVRLSECIQGGVLRGGQASEAGHIDDDQHFACVLGQPVAGPVQRSHGDVVN